MHVIGKQALGGSIYNVTGNSLMVGMAGALETLCGQVRLSEQSVAVQKLAVKIFNAVGEFDRHTGQEISKPSVFMHNGRWGY